MGFFLPRTSPALFPCLLLLRLAGGDNSSPRDRTFYFVFPWERRDCSRQMNAVNHSFRPVSSFSVYSDFLLAPPSSRGLFPGEAARFRLKGKGKGKEEERERERERERARWERREKGERSDSFCRFRFRVCDVVRW